MRKPVSAQWPKLRNDSQTEIYPQVHGVTFSNTEVSRKASKPILTRKNKQKVEHFSLTKALDNIQAPENYKKLVLDKKQCEFLFVFHHLISTDAGDRLNIFNYFLQDEALNLFNKIVKDGFKLSFDQYSACSLNSPEPNPLQLYQSTLLHCRPKYVIAIGAPPTKILLDNQSKLSKIHGEHFSQAYSFSEEEIQTTIIPLYHPEFLLINSNIKKKVWEAIQSIS